MGSGSVTLNIAPLSKVLIDQMGKAMWMLRNDFPCERRKESVGKII